MGALLLGIALQVRRDPLGTMRGIARGIWG